MLKNRWIKYGLIYLVILALANIFWFNFVSSHVKKDLTKTTAIVVALNQNYSGDTNSTFPKYMYYDAQGKQHQYQSTDGFNTITKPIFGLNLGDRVSLYYGKNDPEMDVLVAHGFDYLLAYGTPLILGIFIPLVGLFLWFSINGKLWAGLGRWANDLKSTFLDAIGKS